jgi:BlaI family penicillinase repressor
MSITPRISEAEWEVLAVLRRKPSLTASQVFAELGERTWKLNTVRTFLTRLEKKGVIASQDSPSGRIFRPNISHELLVSEASQSFLDRVFQGATASLLLHFVESKRLSDAEVADLEAILAQKRKENSRASRKGK